MTAAAPEFARADSKSEWILRRFWPIVGVLLLVRLLIGRSLVLLPDEAVYWSWSRHLSLGYLDHPPLLAWLNWLSTHLLGSTELAVRLPVALLAYGSLAVIVFPMGRRLVPGGPGRALLALIWLTSPMLLGFATISTPDTPVFFFQTVALACVGAIAAIDDASSESATSRLARGAGLRSSKSVLRLWLLFGVFSGLAMLSKYTAVLLPGAVVLWLLFSSAGRVHLRQPGIYLAAVVALVIFSPVVYWNATHQWASFAFQLHHGMSSETDTLAAARPAMGFAHLAMQMLMHASTFLGGQALLWTPVLFVLGVITLVCSWLRFIRLSAVDRLTLWSASVPLALFFCAWVKKPGEINWPAFAYVPLSILLVRQITRQPANPARQDAWERWIRQGISVAVAFAIGMHLLLLPQASWFLSKLHLKTPHNISDLHAPWRVMGPLILERSAGAQIICNRHQDAGEVAFYVPGQPDVWCDGVGSRVTAFDFFLNPPDFGRIEQVYFVGGHAHEFADKYRYTFQSSAVLLVARNNARLSRPGALLHHDEITHAPAGEPQPPAESSTTHP